LVQLDLVFPEVQSFQLDLLRFLELLELLVFLVVQLLLEYLEHPVIHVVPLVQSNQYLPVIP
jgi:hypothetical protein